MPRKEQPRVIEAVIKVTEVCNINCTYCYVFNRGDESFKRHDKYMKADTVERLARFLARSAEEINADEIRIDFHGGEPLMLKKRQFDAYCDVFRRETPAHVQVLFALQTNGMLVDEEWIALFCKHKVSVGVSLDGPADVNDVERIDHFGRGTYERARHGLDLLNEAYRLGLLHSFGVLTVASATHSGADAYRHFVHDLKVDNVDFLLPIDSHDGFDPAASRGYGKFLCDAFDAWVADDDPYVHIRLFTNTLSFLQHGDQLVASARKARESLHHLVTISSNGDLGPDDSLRTLPLGLFEGRTIENETLASFERTDAITRISHAENTLPTDCMDCSWKNVCRGGAAHGRLINRFSAERGFNNRSVICDGLQDFYAHVAAHLLSHGVSFDQLTKSLIHAEEPFGSYDGAGCQFAAQVAAEYA